MVDFVWCNFVAEFEPDAMQQIDFLRREMRSVWPEIEDLVLSGRKIELKGQLRFGVGQALPSKPCYARLLNYTGVRRGPQGDRGRLEALRRAEDSFPFIGRGGN